MITHPLSGGMSDFVNLQRGLESFVARTAVVKGLGVPKQS